MGKSLGDRRNVMRIPTYALANTTALRHQMDPSKRGENFFEDNLCPAIKTRIPNIYREFKYYAF